MTEIQQNENEKNPVELEVVLEEDASILTQGTFGKYPKSIGKMYGGGLF